MIFIRRRKNLFYYKNQRNKTRRNRIIDNNNQPCDIFIITNKIDCFFRFFLRFQAESDFSISNSFSLNKKYLKIRIINYDNLLKRFLSPLLLLLSLLLLVFTLDRNTRNRLHENLGFLVIN